MAARDQSEKLSLRSSASGPGPDMTVRQSSTPQSALLEADSFAYQARRRSARNLLRGGIRLLRRGGARDEVDNPRGPLGLNLLFEPSETEVDFVFVHGLNGGSRKTWSASEDPMSFWPSEWLPSERGFQKVRIHSFGYDSDWTKNRKSTLTIHDFGQALLADLANSSHLKRNPTTSIVLVGHSMGGLVIKKAYLLSMIDPLYHDIASRIHSLYFLGTPHRGADTAEVLLAIQSLNIPAGSKSYVAELVPGAGTLQVINDTFRHYHRDVNLWSFYEACPTSTGLTSRMIVSKESAQLGLPGERIKYLQADHRHLCKFDSPDDQNYKSLTECFRTTIEQIVKENKGAVQFKGVAEEVKRISQALGIHASQGMELSTTLEKRHEGSCTWLTTHDAFQAWLSCGYQSLHDTDSAASVGARTRFLWLSGLPGSGKSVSSAHVVRYLEESNMDCAYFFFKSSSKPTARQLLLYLLPQMAQSNFAVRQTLLAMVDDGELDASLLDHTSIWNSIFLSRLFKIEFTQPQFWVIDGLDECPSRVLASLLHMFARINPRFPLRIMVSSRANDFVERLFRQENIETVNIFTGKEGSLKDISAYLKFRLSPRLASPTAAASAANDSLMKEILEKSNGIFLWVTLIVPMLEETYTVEGMRDVLRRIPSEMTGLYAEILDSIRESPSADIAHCILKWVVCAPRPLTTQTLMEAVSFDTKQTLWDSDKFTQICRNMIVVDDGLVKVMHQTAKEFLVSEASGWYINRGEAHYQLAELCLRHLNDRKFSPPLTLRATSMVLRTALSSLDDYVIANVAYHLANSSETASPEDLLGHVAKFASSNLVTWVEILASAGSLGPFPKVIANFRTYLRKYRQTQSSLSHEYQLVESLVADLSRVISIFGTALLDSPASVYNLIPPLCPKSSAFYSLFGKQVRQRILYPGSDKWDERLSCIVLPEPVYSLACNDKYVAVGMLDGRIRVLCAETFEIVADLEHGAPVDHLAYGTVSHILASCSRKRLILWGKHHEELWRVAIPNTPLSMAFNNEDSRILLPSRERAVRSFAASDGSRLDVVPLPGDSSDSDSDSSHRAKKWITPLLVRHCPVLNLTAIAYRSSPLTLAQLDSNEKIGVFEKAGYEGGKRGAQILDVAFSPTSDFRVMAVSYQDGSIITIDPWTQRQVAEVRVHAQFLESSPDGRTLRVGDNEGAILLFNFETMGPIGRIAPLEGGLDGIIFATSSLRLIDIRDRTCNVWEPPALILKSSEDDSSSNTDEMYLPDPELSRVRTFNYSMSISSVAQTSNGKFVFCGREDGTITIHDVASGKQYETLTLHSEGVVIRSLEWHDGKKLLVSTDASNRYIGIRLGTDPRPRNINHPVFDRVADGKILQVQLHIHGTHVLVSTDNGEELIDTSSPNDIVHTRQLSMPGRWLPHPEDSSRLLLLSEHGVEIFKWQGLERETTAPIPVCLPDGIRDRIRVSEWHYRKGGILSQAVKLSNGSETALIHLDISKLQLSTAEIPAVCTQINVLAGVNKILGAHRSKIYFLDKKGWVCSVSAKVLHEHPENYARHFFIPSFWQTGRYSIVRIVSKRDVVFAHEDDLVVFQNFLEFEEKLSFGRDISKPDEVLVESRLRM